MRVSLLTGAILLIKSNEIEANAQARFKAGISGRYVLRRRFPETGDASASSSLERDPRLWTAVLVISLHDISEVIIGPGRIKQHIWM